MWGDRSIKMWEGQSRNIGSLINEKIMMIPRSVWAFTSGVEVYPCSNSLEVLKVGNTHSSCCHRSSSRISNYPTLSGWSTCHHHASSCLLPFQVRVGAQGFEAQGSYQVSPACQAEVRLDVPAPQVKARLSAVTAPRNRVNKGWRSPPPWMSHFTA